MKYPSWICYECGHKAQPNKRRIFTMSTFHDGDKCGVCEQVKPTTELRDFGFPTPDQIKAVREQLRHEAKD